MHSSLFQQKPSKPQQDARVAALEAEIAALQAILGDEDAEKIVARHIKLLHEYNEAKDATQVLIGRLADHKETSIKQLHDDYGLDPED